MSPAGNVTTQPAGLNWLARGDLNAFFGLMLDNVGDMILMAGLLVGAFAMPRDFVLGRMIPGTALVVLVGDLIYTGMAIRMARRTGRRDVTAMPLGLDTPSTFGAVFLIMGPAFQGARAAGLDDLAAARHAWYIGIAMTLASGLFKLLCAPFAGWVRRIVPRAGLLGSLTAIALVIISFLPLLDIAAEPVAGLSALAVILATFTARWELPKRIPGALAAVVIGLAIHYALAAFGFGPGLIGGASRPSGLRVALPFPMFDWLDWFRTHWGDALEYLPVAIPLSLATIVGGIDCSESASAAGDDYHPPRIIAAEGFATLVGACFGGVIQSTPYIGHPAYKAMGARAGYTLATALFVGFAGILGYFDWIFLLLPKAVVFPILIFVGLEIAAQSFHATPARHYPAIVLACVPALAYLALIALGRVLPETGKPFAALSLETRHWVATTTMLAGGFIVTSLLWATFLAKLIDRKIIAASATMLLGAVFAFFGVIHSALPSSPIVAPGAAVERLAAEGRLTTVAFQTPYHWAAAYACVAILLLILAAVGRKPDHPRDDTPIAV